MRRREDVTSKNYSDGAVSPYGAFLPNIPGQVELYDRPLFSWRWDSCAVMEKCADSRERHDARKRGARAV